MIQGKKGFGLLLKIFLLVLMVVIVVGAFWSLLSTSKKTAESLVKKQLDQYQLQANSFIHPDLNIENQNFWRYQFMNFINASVHTQNFASGQNFCYGTFYTEPGFKKLNKWTLTFLQDGNDIIISLKDSRNTLAAAYPANKENNELAGMKLCIKTADGREIDVHQITVQFGEDRSYYYTTEELLTTGKKKDFPYKPYNLGVEKGLEILPGLEINALKPDIDYMNTFFYSYTKESKKLCIMPMEKSGKESSLSNNKIKSLFSDQKTGYPRYRAFCDTPENAVKEGVAETNLKTCFYTPCAFFSSDEMRKAGLIESEVVESLTDTTCARFSTGCGGKCIPSNDVSRARPDFKCEPCTKYKSCSDFREPAVCNATQSLCSKMNCEWKWKDRYGECVPR